MSSSGQGPLAKVTYFAFRPCAGQIARRRSRKARRRNRIRRRGSEPSGYWRDSRAARRARIHDIDLIIGDLGIERREVQGQPLVEEFVLHAQLIGRDVFRFDDRGRDHRVVVGVDRNAGKIDAAGFVTLGIGPIDHRVRRDIIGKVGLSRDAAIGEMRRIGLRPDDRQQLRDIAGVVGAGPRMAAGCGLAVAARLVFIGVAQAGREVQLVGDVPGDLGEPA